MEVLVRLAVCFAVYFLHDTENAVKQYDDTLTDLLLRTKEKNIEGK